MLQTAMLLLFLTGAYPVWRAWRANLSTSLAHAMTWMAAAWLAWAGVMVCFATTDLPARLDVPRYLALSLTGCAGVAVLGARRPGVAAWNFVVLGLLAILLLPLAEGALATGESLSLVRKLFLAATVAIGIVNYAPTRLWVAANQLGWGIVNEFIMLGNDTYGVYTVTFICLVGLAPWFAYLGWRLRSQPAGIFDRAWLDFRDRYGLVWGQRVREQFNRAAANAGWPISLAWGGLRALPGAAQLDEQLERAALDALDALLKRFNVSTERGASAL
jgi:hypothetical protein